jgi:glycosyltransferase involved in cell wall biosynthesis
VKLLVVVPYAPTLIRTRPYNLVRSLARRGHALSLATVWENERERAALDALAHEGLEVLAAPLHRARTAVNGLTALAAGQPLQARYCWQPELVQKVAQRLEQTDHTFDIAHVEHLRGAEYGRWLKRAGGALMPVVWDSVDCISLLFEQTAQRSRSRPGRWMARLELPRTRRYEAAAVRAFDGILATSARDAAALDDLGRAFGPAPGAAGRSPARVRTLPNGVDSDYFVPGDPPNGPPRIVLSGKMSYHANVTAALTLVNDIMPLVWAQRPEVEVVVAGSAPARAVQQLASMHSGRVQVTGYVADLRPHLQGATVAAAPIPYGAGIQNKVLEAMACGLPVVASPQAGSALQARPGIDLLLASEPAEFAAALLTLLADPALRQALGQAGRQYAVTHHRWEQIVADLEAMYSEVLDQREGMLSRLATRP